MKPILEALKGGEKFSYSMLSSHFEDCLEYWEHWWAHASVDRLTRPEIIADDDPILGETITHRTVDTISDHEFFDSFLDKALRDRLLPRGFKIPRAEYHEALIEHLSGRGLLQPEKVIVFVGGGYGAGKTTILSMSGCTPFLPLPQKSIVGVDAFKLFLPEYEAIRRIGDGRASSVVQREARKLSDDLFHLLLSRQCSFMWDSSMSDRDASLRRIADARVAGYRLIMVAVASPVEAAMARAMRRAYETRRFAHPAHFEASHKNFARVFEAYFDVFDEVKLFWNQWNPGLPPQDPTLIAEKDCSDNTLVSYGDKEIEQFRSLANQ